MTIIIPPMFLLPFMFTIIMFTVVMVFVAIIIIMVEWRSLVYSDMPGPPPGYLSI